LISDVSANSPASRAGLQTGDIVLELNGQAVNGPDDLSVHIAETAPGTTVHLKISRNGQMHDVKVTLGEQSEKSEASTSEETGGAALQGVQVQNLTPAIARDLGLSTNTSGVVITSVDPSAAAATAGLQRGDVIQEVNRKPVRDVMEYRRALAESNNQPILLLVNRDGATHFVIVQLQ
jgi:serine protease Do